MKTSAYRRPATAAKPVRRSLVSRQPEVSAPPRNPVEAANRLAAYRDEAPRGTAIEAEINELLSKLADGGYGALGEAIAFLRMHQHPPRRS